MRRNCDYTHDEIAKKIGARYEGQYHQKDTYYRVDDGRLKLRETGTEESQLIYYLRPDQRGPAVSELTGTGVVPVEKQVQVLVAGGYDGFYGFEWEKKWHPEIEPPEVAFPHYAETVGRYLADAGVRPS